MDTNTTSGLSDLSKQITKNNNANVEKFTNTLYEELVVEVPINAISEVVFKEYFLDFFKTGTQGNHDAPLTLKWLELAGGPYNEVNVIDNMGVILYTTPGLYVRPQAGKNLDGTDLNNIASNFNLKANRLYNDGLNYLEGQIGNLTNEVNLAATEHQLRWKNIFNRYNETTNDATSKVPEKLADNIGAFLDYD